MNEHSWGNWPIFIAVLGGLFVILAALWPYDKQERKKQREDQEDDIKTLNGILNYLNPLELHLESLRESETPVHVILPTLEEVRFHSNNHRLQKIGTDYSSLVFDIRSMENHINIQGSPETVGTVGIGVLGRQHRDMRKAVLNKIKALKKIIENFIKKPSW